MSCSKKEREFYFPKPIDPMYWLMISGSIKGVKTLMAKNKVVGFKATIEGEEALNKIFKQNL